VALRGENFDGHDYLQTAVKNGAACLLISDKEKGQEYDAACVVVEDTLTALGALALWRRRAVRKMNDPLIVGITGSCGKTTVKEMTAAILLRNWPDKPDQPTEQVLKTIGNFNNLFGLPLSLLPVSAKHCGVVLELGMNMPGEIARLTEIAEPDIACITNIHGVHLEGLGSIEGVAEAKAELFSNTSKDALHVINLDDERVVNCGMNHTQKKVGYAVTGKGLAQNPDVWAESVDVDNSGHLSFILHVKEQQSKLTIHAPGLHNSSNACAAAAIAYAGGIDFDIIVRGLEDFRSPANRMETLKSPSGLNILNDTYNANPASMASGLKTFVQLPAVTRMAILGDMLELGEASGELHEELGHLAASLGIDFLGVTGDFSEKIKDGALSGGLEAARIVVFEDKKRVVDWVAELVHSDRLQPGDWVLVKASRGLALDTVVRQLLEIC
jgi:murE/murF fusion protein